MATNRAGGVYWTTANWENRMGHGVDGLECLECELGESLESSIVELIQLGFYHVNGGEIERGPSSQRFSTSRSLNVA